jgi:hypothetical protein
MNKVIERQIEALTELDKAISEMAYIFSSDTPCIGGLEALYSLPYDFRIIKVNRSEFEMHDFSLVHEKQWSDDGVLGQWYRRGTANITIFYRPQMAGSTCKITKIGEETKTVPIYEVTCMEA